MLFPTNATNLKISQKGKTLSTRSSDGTAPGKAPASSPNVKRASRLATTTKTPHLSILNSNSEDDDDTEKPLSYPLPSSDEEDAEVEIVFIAPAPPKIKPTSYYTALDLDSDDSSSASSTASRLKALKKKHKLQGKLTNEGNEDEG
jgi:hypothetical protein